MRRLLIGLLALAWAGQAHSQPQTPEDMVLVPAGEFVMGSERGAADEGPVHTVFLSAFYIDKNEVTTSAFAAFVRDSANYDTIEGSWFRYSVAGCLDLMIHYESRYGGRSKDAATDGFDHEAQRRWRDDLARWTAAEAALRSLLGETGKFPGSNPTYEIAARPDVQDMTSRQARLPVRGVTWRDAAAFAQWVGKRLSTEAEWEKAARGTDQRTYPWGDQWDPRRCRAGLDPDAGPMPVGSFPAGASASGCMDMAGNVWEWVADWYGETCYASPGSGRDPQGPDGLPEGRLPGPRAGDSNLLASPLQGRESDTRKVIRGGGWGGPESQARFNVRSARRLWSNPSYWHPDIGFRCAKDF